MFAEIFNGVSNHVTILTLIGSFVVSFAFFFVWLSILEWILTRYHKK